MYTDAQGLEQYAGATAFDRLLGAVDMPIERALERVETRLMAYIAPNEPACDVQREAFARAAYAQILYEHDDAQKQLRDMPSGVKSFTVNGFSVSLDGARAGAMPYGIAPEARAELLLSGLLYKGVDCIC